MEGRTGYIESAGFSFDSTSLTTNAIGSGTMWLRSETEDTPGTYLVIAEGQAGSTAQGEMELEPPE